MDNLKSEKIKFGTDGIRGEVNKSAVNPFNIQRIGYACAVLIKQKYPQIARPFVVIGNDGRLSHFMLEGALLSGLFAYGIDVINLQLATTPQVALVTKSLQAQLGIMISASHNPYYDNGIKIFSTKGEKIDQQDQAEIEAILEADLSGIALSYREDLGRQVDKDIPHGELYREYLYQSMSDLLGSDLMPFDLQKKANQHIFSGIKVVIDCANGGASDIAPRVLRELVSEVVVLSDQPNGININLGCGALHPDALSQAVIAEKADIGIAFDGDADRILLVNSLGEVLDGDDLIGIIAKMMLEKFLLKGNKVVLTQMANLGLVNYLQELGIEVNISAVGDRYVFEQMQKQQALLGGEQSGHIIIGEEATTGDALLVALYMLYIIKNYGGKILQNKEYSNFPQKLKNLPLRKMLNSENISIKDDMQKLVDKFEAELNEKTSGRILVRPSGTEPLLRIMVEAEDEEILDDIILRLYDKLDLLLRNNFAN